MTLAPAYAQQVTPGTLTLRDFADPAGMPVRRRGAVCGSDGVLAFSVNTSGPFTYSGSATYRGSGLQTLCGRRAPDCFELRVTANGALELNENGSTLARSADGVVPQDGSPFSWAIDVATTGITGRVNENMVVQDLSAHVIATGTQTQWIGRAFTSDPQYWRGVIWDFRRTDNATSANTAYFPLDARTPSGTYPNQHPGSTVADATVTGTVLPVIVNASGGDGVPVYPGPVVVSMRRDTPLSVTAGSGTILLNAGVDPLGWYGLNAISVPLKHHARLTLTGRMRATALAGVDDIQVRFRSERPGINYHAITPLTLNTLNKWVPFHIQHVEREVPAGTKWLAFYEGINGGDTIEIDDTYLTAIITPSTTV